MPTTKRRLSLANMVTVLGALEPTLAHAEHRIFNLNGYVVNIFIIQPVTDPEVNCQLASKIARVQGGVVVNMTTGAIVAVRIKPLATNASIGVVAGSLPADQTYIAVVYGAEITN